MNAGHFRSHETEQVLRTTLWLVGSLLAALVLLFFVPLVFFIGLLAALALALALSTAWTAWRNRARETLEFEVRMLLPDQQLPLVQEIMDIRVATEEDGVQIYRGPLRESAKTAYGKCKAAFHSSHVSLLQKDDRLGATLMLVPRLAGVIAQERKISTWPNWILFFVTMITTTWVGASYQGIDLLKNPEAFPAGLSYSLGLLSILGVHELGHFFAARYHGMKVTPPFFLPVPFGLGTFGAFIKMRSPSENRKALFDVAVAGPLAGLCIAIPALLIGLQFSSVVESPGPFRGTPVGSSVLFALLAKFGLSETVQINDWVRLSPLAFAGWLGLFVTALNLLPVGQLDGGHIMRSMFGHRIGSAISSLVMCGIFFLAFFVLPGLMLWAFIIFLLARRASPPLNDITPISPGRKWLGALCFIILLTIFVPLPQAWSNPFGHTFHF